MICLCSMLSGSSARWLEGWSDLTANCCNTLKAHSFIFLVVYAGCEWDLSWSYQPHTQMWPLHVALTSSQYGNWFPGCVQREPDRSRIILSNLPSESCSIASTIFYSLRKLHGLARLEGRKNILHFLMRISKVLRRHLEPEYCRIHFRKRQSVTLYKNTETKDGNRGGGLWDDRLFNLKKEPATTYKIKNM